MEITEEIIHRSEQLFMKLGIRSVSMDDISRELGISKKTLYQHFENKDSLVEAVIASHILRAKDGIEGICKQAGNALEEIRNIGVFIMASIKDVSPSTLYDLQKYHYRSWVLFRQKQDRQVIGSIMKNIERGVSEGLYRKDLTPEIIAKIYAKAANMIVEEISNAQSSFSRRQLIWELHNYHIHAIATPKGLELWKQYNSEIQYNDVIN